MLFSQPEVAAFLNQNFECAWESLRPVPKVLVDFGGGTRLERTLLGNIATWFCLADGRVVDVLPGLCDADEYLARSRAALAAHAAEVASTAGWPQVRLQLQARAAAAARGEPTDPPEPGPEVADLSKMRVEGRIRAPFQGRNGDAADLAGARAAARRVPDASKRIVERPLRRAAALDDVEADTRYNRQVRYAQAWLLLAASPTWPRPSEVREALFDQVLHVPLSDPFLGLAPDVPGGEGGRTVGGEAQPPRR